jgi:hypothetical protein
LIKSSPLTVETVLKSREYRSRTTTLRAEKSLYVFLQQAWRAIEGDTPFTGGWHIEAIAEHLEACYRREIQRLLINVPPRSSKSSLVSIAFPAWAWIHNPEEQFIYASYAASLSLAHSLKCRRLIESPWYQNNWGHRVQLSKDQRSKGEFQNMRGGHRIATSVGGSTTGRGGHILVCDDPNNVQDAESEAKRENTLQWKSQVWPSRFNNPKESCEIVIQHRVHEQDISGMKLQTLCDKGKQSVQTELRNTIIGQCTHLMFGEYTKVMAKGLCRVVWRWIHQSSTETNAKWHLASC